MIPADGVRGASSSSLMDSIWALALDAATLFSVLHSSNSAELKGAGGASSLLPPQSSCSKFWRALSSSINHGDLEVVCRVILDHVMEAPIECCFRNCWNCCNCRYRENWRNDSQISRNGCNCRYRGNRWDDCSSSCCLFKQMVITILRSEMI